HIIAARRQTREQRRSGCQPSWAGHNKRNDLFPTTDRTCLSWLLQLGQIRLPHGKKSLLPALACSGCCFLSWPPVDWLLARPWKYGIRYVHFRCAYTSDRGALLGGKSTALCTGRTRCRIRAHTSAASLPPGCISSGSLYRCWPAAAVQ